VWWGGDDAGVVVLDEDDSGGEESDGLWLPRAEMEGGVEVAVIGVVRS